MSTYARFEDPGRRASLPAAPVVRSRDPLLVALGGRVADALVTIDFECFHSSDYGLTKLTNEAFVRDPRFEVIGVGVKLGAHPTAWLEEWEFREWASRVDWNRMALVAHHAQFDGFILSERYGIKPAFILCTMSMARALHSEASLEYLGPLYGAGQKGDEIGKTKGKNRRHFTHEEWLRFGEYCIQDVAITEKIVHPMVRRLPPYELWLVDTVVRSFTEPTFRADRDVLVKARDAERKKKSDLLQSVARRFAHDTVIGLTGAAVEEAARAILASNDKFAALLKSMGVEPPQKISNTTGELTWAFAKSDPGFKALLEHDRDDVRALAETRLAVKSTILETRADRIIQISERGLIPMYLKFAGAHTGRLSGGDKMNPQNFNRGGDLRAAILSQAGQVIVVVDSSQIEARVLPWLAGDKAKLDLFARIDQQNARYAACVAEHMAQGLGKKAAERQTEDEGLTEGDFYSERGSQFFQMEVSKKKTPDERQVSKNMELGLGYSMGWGKFGGEMLKGMLGSKPVQFTTREVEKYKIDVSDFEQRQWGRSGSTCGEIVEGMRSHGIRLPYADLLVHCAVADYLVRRYRETNKPIAQLWRGMETVIRTMAQPGGDPEVVRMSYGPLKIRYQSIEQPSGRRLRYPGLRQHKDGSFTYLGGAMGREHTKIYGGLLTENCVQSIARDIVMEQALWIRAKYANAIPGRRSPIGTTTHDEVVTVVPAELGPECLAYSLERMKVPPAWCQDLPLSASGGFGVSYGSIK